MTSSLPRKWLETTQNFLDKVMSQAATHAMTIIYLVLFPIIVLRHQAFLNPISDKLWQFGAFSLNFDCSFANSPPPTAPAKVRRHSLIQSTGEFFLFITIFSVSRTIMGSKFMGNQQKVDEILVAINEDFFWGVLTYFLNMFIMKRLHKKILEFRSAVASPSRAIWTFKLMEHLWVGGGYHLNLWPCLWLGIGQLFNGNQVRWLHYIKLDLKRNLLVYNDLIIGIMINLTVLTMTLCGFFQEEHAVYYFNIGSDSLLDWKQAVRISAVIFNSFAYSNVVRISRKVFKVCSNDKLEIYWDWWNTSKSSSSSSRPGRRTSGTNKKSDRNSDKKPSSRSSTTDGLVKSRSQQDLTNLPACEEVNSGIVLPKRKSVRFLSPTKEFGSPLIQTCETRSNLGS